jgi:hypothetical protein
MTGPLPCAHRVRWRPAFGLVRSWHLGQPTEVRRRILVLTVLGLTTVVEVRTRSASTGVTHLGHTLTSLHAVPDSDVNLVQVGEGVQLLVPPHDLDLEPKTLGLVLHIGHDPVYGRERRGPTDRLEIHRLVSALHRDRLHPAVSCPDDVPGCDRWDEPFRSYDHWDPHPWDPNCWPAPFMSSHPGGTGGWAWGP